ncbi:type 1 glutamine amidotransferase [Geomobilimonas luticola]|uniref:type 1 glutamine amidotransferase n=1 Tax=Geomobilimonas luticola TaxID=1114878 RepID=UPI001FEC36B8|nr:type 1 glutamine amidotransferase [Geomobilimonas luticola]
MIPLLTIVQNDPEVPLGSYADYLAELAVPYRTVQPSRGEMLPEAEGVAAAIILGGAMGVHDTDRHPFLHEVKHFIAEMVDGEVPLLGICLGGQLLADVLGATVTYNSPHREKGTLPVILTEKGESDPLFAGVSREFVSFQWHNDSFLVPEGGVLLASSPTCPGQAFRYGPVAYGTQFHPEVNRRIIADWSGRTPERMVRTRHYQEEFDLRLREYDAASRRILLNFLNIARLVESHPA